MKEKLNPVRIKFSKRAKILTVLILGLSFLSPIFGFDAEAIEKTASVVVTICGNNIIEGDEVCDGTDLAGESCQSRGYDGGTLSCKLDCSGFDTSGCTTEEAPSPPPPSGGGGGGGYTPPSPPSTSVVIQGLAYPGAEITILKDGQVATGGILADSDGNFKVTLTTLEAGIYTFGVWAEDKYGRRSINFSFTVTVTSGMTTTISGIFIPPTIELDKTGVARGEILNILGQSAPRSEITVKINSPGEIIKTTATTDSGDWDYPFNTSPLEDGAHYVKAKADLNGFQSSYSSVLAFYVGGTSGCPIKADLNGDAKVNLVDFSILLYNWGTPRSVKADINCDGWVNLVDFSIMMYQWTG